MEQQIENSILKSGFRLLKRKAPIMSLKSRLFKDKLGEQKNLARSFLIIVL